MISEAALLPQALLLTDWKEMAYKNVVLAHRFIAALALAWLQQKSKMQHWLPVCEPFTFLLSAVLAI